MSLRVHISPTLDQVKDDNGVGRVVIAQHKYLQEQGIEIVSPDRAEVITAHITGEGLPRVDVLSLHGLYWTGDPGSGTYNRWHHDANRRIMAAARVARAITVPSGWVSNSFKRDMRINPTVIGHGIEVDEWQPAEHLGYVLWNKNRAADSCDPTPALELAKRGIKTVTTFAPDGERPASLYVTGTVPHDKMKQLVCGAEVYLATTKETFGIGTLEAMAAGVPILGYDYGGTSDLVVHGETGYLVRPGDIDDLMAGLDYIRTHRQRLATNAREHARGYTWQRVAAQYAELYRRVAEMQDENRPAVIDPAIYTVVMERGMAL